MGNMCMKRNVSLLWVNILFFTIIVCSSFAGAFTVDTDTDGPRQPLESIIQDVRGGFGVKAIVSNYQLAWGNRPVVWFVIIEGEHVWFGSSSGYVDSMSAGVARSSLVPPTLGYGPVSVSIKVTVRTGQSDEGVISQVQRSGFMLGPLIILL